MSSDEAATHRFKGSRPQRTRLEHFSTYSQITCDHFRLVASTAAYQSKADRSQLRVGTLRVNKQSASLHRHQWDHPPPSPLSLSLATKHHHVIVRSTFGGAYLQHTGRFQFKCKKIAQNHEGGCKMSPSEEQLRRGCVFFSGERLFSLQIRRNSW